MDSQHRAKHSRPPDLLMQQLHKLLRFAVRLLAILMVVVVFWSVANVALQLYKRLISPPFLFLKGGDLLILFGSFLAALIAIEIFSNIELYLREDVVHIRLVLSTALMAVARKVIILDYKSMGAGGMLGLSAVIFALGAAYWLVVASEKGPTEEAEEMSLFDHDDESDDSGTGVPEMTQAQVQADESSAAVKAIAAVPSEKPVTES